MRLLYSLFALVLTLAFVLSPDLVLSYSSGAPATASGSPISEAAGIGDCSACHGSFEVNSGTGSVTIEAPATFTPGETVTITVTVNNTTPPVGTPKQGFEISVEDDAAQAHVGTLIVDDVNTRFAGGDEHFATHTSTGNQDTTWTVGWTAPVEAPETVTIYAAGNATNGDFSPTGDYIYTTSLTMQRSGVANEPEAVPLAARLDAVFPNPFVETAAVTYTLDRPMAVTLTLYDGVGRVVRVLEDGVRSAGAHTVPVEAGDLAAGTYFVQVRSEAGTEVRALTLAR